MPRCLRGCSTRLLEIHEDIFVKEAQLLKRGAVNHKAGAKDEIEWLLFALAREAGASGEVGNVSAAIGLHFFRLQIIANDGADYPRRCLRSGHHRGNGLRLDDGVIVQKPNVIGIATAGDECHRYVVSPAESGVSPGLN